MPQDRGLDHSSSWLMTFVSQWPSKSMSTTSIFRKL